MERSWRFWVVFAVLKALVMSLAVLLANSRKQARVDAGVRVLTHPPITLILGLVLAVFVVLGALTTDFNSTRAEVPALFLLCGALVSALVAGEGWWVRHELRAEGIRYRGLWTRCENVAWGEIVSAHWSPSLKWLVLTTRDGRRLRFAAMLNGLESLAASLLLHVPGLKMDSSTAQVLVEARGGKLPEVW